MENYSASFWTTMLARVSHDPLPPPIPERLEHLDWVGSKQNIFSVLELFVTFWFNLLTFGVIQNHLLVWFVNPCCYFGCIYSWIRTPMVRQCDGNGRSREPKSLIWAHFRCRFSGFQICLEEKGSWHRCVCWKDCWNLGMLEVLPYLKKILFVQKLSDGFQLVTMLCLGRLAR